MRRKQEGPSYTRIKKTSRALRIETIVLNESKPPRGGKWVTVASAWPFVLKRNTSSGWYILVYKPSRHVFAFPPEDVRKVKTSMRKLSGLLHAA